MQWIRLSQRGADQRASFVKEEADNYNNTVTASSNVKYDLIGKLVDETKLTRKRYYKDFTGDSTVHI